MKDLISDDEKIQELIGWGISAGNFGPEDFKKLHDLADLAENAWDELRELKQSQWVSVEDRLPITEKDMECFDYKTVDVIGYDGRSVRPIEVQSGATHEYWITLDHDPLDVTEITHWMPLPPPPKEES